MPPNSQSSQPKQLSLLSESLDRVSESAGIRYHHKIYAITSHGLWYYRYVCNQGNEILIQATIPGGQVSNPIAQARAGEVKRWIDQGLSPAEIQHRIKSWPRRRRRSGS